MPAVGGRDRLPANTRRTLPVYLASLSERIFYRFSGDWHSRHRPDGSLGPESLR